MSELMNYLDIESQCRKISERSNLDYNIVLSIFYTEVANAIVENLPLLELLQKYEEAIQNQFVEERIVRKAC